MHKRRTIALVIAMLAAGFGLAAQAARPTPEQEIVAFNDKLRQMHLDMDNQGIFAAWAEDGVDLMPGEEPIVGKKAVVARVEGIVASLKDYKVTRQDMEFHDIRVSGDWASEWATEHQVVQPTGGKEPIETWGKMALVLHRDVSGAWKIEQEMWNQGRKP